MQVHQNSYRRKKSKIQVLTLHSPFFAFLSSLESTSLDHTITCASKWFILTQRMQNLESVNLKCVIYAQPDTQPFLELKLTQLSHSLYSGKAKPNRSWAL